MAAKQIAFRMSSYKGFATRRHATRVGLPPSVAAGQTFEFLGRFSPASDIERAAMLTQAAHNRTSRPHPLTPS
jgi:hypothetical protein